MAKKKAKGKPGRPPEMGKTRDASVLVRCLPAEKKRWQRAAKDVPLATWLRNLANDASGES